MGAVSHNNIKETWYQTLKKKAKYSGFLKQKILNINVYLYRDSGGRVIGLSHLDFQMNFSPFPLRENRMTEELY